MLRRKCSEQVSYSLAVNPAEIDELIADLPERIRKDLRAHLDRELVVLRYDAVSRCAYYVAREENNLVVWLWCEMRLQMAGQLLAVIVELDRPMDGATALELYERAVAVPN